MIYPGSSARLLVVGSLEHPDHPHRKGVAELRFDLHHRDGKTVTTRDLAIDLGVAPHQVMELESGFKTTDSAGWTTWEEAIRRLHTKAIGESAYRPE